MISSCLVQAVNKDALFHCIETLKPTLLLVIDNNNWAIASIYYMDMVEIMLYIDDYK